MKRDGSGTPIVLALSVVLLLIVAIGAGLQTKLFFAGPLLTPGKAPPPPAVHQTPATQPPATGTPQYDNHSVVFPVTIIVIVLAVLAAAVLVAFVLLWLRHRPRRSKIAFVGGDIDINALDDSEQAAADLPTLRRGLTRASDVLGSEREPRDAIVRAWIGLQEAAEDSGMTRRASETPTEFTTRVFDSVNADRHAANILLDLYLRVRFGATPATAADVEQAQDAIATLAATWPASVAT